MKNIVLALLLALETLQVSAQIVYESSFISTANMSHEDFGITCLDSFTCVYHYINYEDEMIVLYNLDHSIFQIIDIPVYYVSNPANYRITYISKSLFDCDPTNIEYLLNFNNYSNTNPVSYVKVFRTDGSCIFNANDANIAISFGGASILNPGIFKTPEGTKMILKKNQISWDTYSLCGNLPLFIENSNDILLSKAAFPNPTTNQITLPYELPKEVNKGFIKVYNLNGQLISSFEVDKNFTNLIFNATDLANGQYYYEVSSIQGVHTSQKFMKQ